MTGLELDSLAQEICGWLDDQVKDAFPAECVCEAVAIFPMVKWLAKNGFNEVRSERSDLNESPYVAYDLAACAQGEKHIFEVKFCRRSISLYGLLRDLLRLGIANESVRWRYILVIIDQAETSGAGRQISALKLLNPQYLSLNLADLPLPAGVAARKAISAFKEQFHLPDDAILELGEFVTRRSGRYQVVARRIMRVLR